MEETAGFIKLQAPSARFVRPDLRKRYEVLGTPLARPPHSRSKVILPHRCIIRCPLPLLSVNICSSDARSTILASTTSCSCAGSWPAQPGNKSSRCHLALSSILLLSALTGIAGWVIPLAHGCPAALNELDLILNSLKSFSRQMHALPPGSLVSFAHPL